MYTEFYGLREKPFSLLPDPRFLFLAQPHREALAHLLYGIEQGEGFICVTGEVGMGKTTLCRTLLERLGPDVEVAFLFNPSQSGAELMRAISVELGLPTEGRTRGQLHEQLNDFLLDMRRRRRRVLLIIDEAQNLSAATLEEVRLLSNLETPTSKLIQILLFGQPELDAKLDSDGLRQLRQRISVRWKLARLSTAETRDYVRHRLRIAAGGECDVLSERALREVHRRTAGTPRLVNLLADRALLAGFAAGEKVVDADRVSEAAREVLGTTARRPARGALLGWAFLTLALAAGVAIAWQQLSHAPLRVSSPPPVAADVAAPAPSVPAGAAAPGLLGEEAPPDPAAATPAREEAS
jgi:general secretion pathway protein A